MDGSNAPGWGGAELLRSVSLLPLAGPGIEGRHECTRIQGSPNPKAVGKQLGK